MQSPERTTRSDALCELRKFGAVNDCRQMTFMSSLTCGVAWMRTALSCHFGSRLLLPQIAPQGGMSQGVVVWTGETTEEGTSLLSVLATVWAITFLAGALCGVWLERSRSGKTPVRSTALASWERVTVRALRFLAKRRRVSLAFSNYRNHNLRGVNPGPARQRARRRVATPSRILHEGFALPRHGSNGSRATGNHNAPGSPTMGGH